MVIDTSALIAILLGEPDAERFARALGDAPVRLLSAVTRAELSFVIEGRKGETGRADVELLLAMAASTSSASRRNRPRSPSTRFVALVEAATGRG